VIDRGTKKCETLPRREGVYPRDKTRTGGCYLHFCTACSKSSINIDDHDNTFDSTARESVREIPADMKQLQDTAAEAIATVSKARKRSGSSDDGNSAGALADHNDNNKDTAAKPYSKRRKKPRLNECETKLSELRAENEMLKRHLDNISNRTAKLHQERMEMEQKMTRMSEEGAPDEEVDAIIKKYSEMYSDYGKKRDQELTFHLEQLQRYVHSFRCEETRLLYFANPVLFANSGLPTQPILPRWDCGRLVSKAVTQKIPLQESCRKNWASRLNKAGKFLSKDRKFRLCAQILKR
jgi:Skp family chaperone for outer membrane proteins